MTVLDVLNCVTVAVLEYTNFTNSSYRRSHSINWKSIDIKYVDVMYLILYYFVTVHTDIFFFAYFTYN